MTEENNQTENVEIAIKEVMTDSPVLESPLQLDQRLEEAIKNDNISPELEKELIATLNIDADLAAIPFDIITSVIGKFRKKPTAWTLSPQNRERLGKAWASYINYKLPTWLKGNRHEVILLIITIICLSEPISKDLMSKKEDINAASTP